jgi:hypothetical protein
MSFSPYNPLKAEKHYFSFTKAGQTQVQYKKIHGWRLFSHIKYHFICIQLKGFHALKLLQSMKG